MYKESDDCYELRPVADCSRPNLEPRRAIFTIVSANYISFAATLMQTVRAHHPAAARFIVLSDAFQEFPDIDLAATLWGCEDMGISLLDNMKLWYNVVEFNTAIKPFCFQYFFSTL